VGGLIVEPCRYLPGMDTVFLLPTRSQRKAGYCERDPAGQGRSPGVRNDAQRLARLYHQRPAPPSPGGSRFQQRIHVGSWHRSGADPFNHRRERFS